MSQKTLDIIKKHISDTLGVELISAHTDKDREAFNVNIDGNIICIFISRPFISRIKGSDDIARDLEELDILTFVKNNPMHNISPNFSGIVIEPING